MIAEPRPVVLVTGSSGLIGTAVTEKLNERYQVVGLDVVEPQNPIEGVSFIRCDLSSDQGVQQALERVRHEYGGRIASVVHLAAYVDFSGEPSEKYTEITVRGTQRLLRRLKQFEHVGQFLFSSTMLVHAPCEPGEAISEEWPLDPRWPYPESKVQTEQIILTEHGDIPVVILRLAGVYDDYCHSLPLSNQIQRIAEKWITAYVYPGDTSHGQTLVHLDDLTESIRLAVDRREEFDDELVLLIGEPEPMSYDALQQRIAELIHGPEEGRNWHTRQIPKSVAKTGAWVQEHVPGMSGDEFIKPWMIGMADDHYALDVGRARRLLGWQPRHCLPESLPNMIEAMRKDPVGWYREHNLELPDDLKQQAAEREGTERVQPESKQAKQD